MDDISSRIRAHREARGWSLSDLTHRLNLYGLRVTRQWVYKKERGVSKVTIPELMQFALALGCSPARLLGADGEEIWITGPPITREERDAPRGHVRNGVSVTHRELCLWLAGAVEAIVPVP